MYGKCRHGFTPFFLYRGLQHDVAGDPVGNSAVLGAFVALNVVKGARTRSFPSPSLGGFGFIVICRASFIRLAAEKVLIVNLIQCPVSSRRMSTLGRKLTQQPHLSYSWEYRYIL